MTKNLLELKDINKSFKIKGAADTLILEHINLHVTEGEFLAILGPSGSGKSTLLRIISGLLPASSGTVSYLGKEIHSVNPGVAMVFQSFALFPWLTVLENVMLGLEKQHISKQDKIEKSMKMLDIVGLDGFESAYPKELSGGMRQRVGIGRALVSEPDILLMDEAFSALDVLTAENLRRDLLELWLDKKIPTKAIVLVTHNIEEAVYMADRAVLLSSHPATIINDMVIDLLRWRNKKSPEFLTYVDNIYSIMTKKKIPIVVPVAPAKKDLPIPAVTAEALTGFLELLEDLNEKIDLYKLADRFLMDMEDFLPLIEAASLLQFAKVTEGDIELTEQGKEFARATVLVRKNLFRKQLLENVPFVQKMINILRSKANKQINADFFTEILSQMLGEDLAEKQLDLLISWERYAELIEYDDNKEIIYLEESLK